MELFNLNQLKRPQLRIFVWLAVTLVIPRNNMHKEILRAIG